MEVVVVVVTYGLVPDHMIRYLFLVPVVAVVGEEVEVVADTAVVVADTEEEAAPVVHILVLLPVLAEDVWVIRQMPVSVPVMVL
jgi:hypothetical protein